MKRNNKGNGGEGHKAKVQQVVYVSILDKLIIKLSELFSYGLVTKQPVYSC